MTDDTPNPRRFIVYELRRPDGAPFYVGKGLPHRPRAHKRSARRGEQSHVNNVIRKLWREGLDLEVAVVFETTDETAALLEERRVIEAHRTAGVPLANRTTGGDGMPGYHHSPETRALMSAVPRTPEWRARIAAVNRRRTLSAETRAKIAAAAAGRKCPPRGEGYRAKQQAAQKGKPRGPLSEEHRAKISAAQRGKPKSPETRERMRAAWLKRRGADSEAL